MTVAAGFWQDTDFINVLYIVAFVLFIVGLRMRTDRRCQERGLGDRQEDGSTSR